MIKFSLKCAEDHRFDSWFQSAASFDKLARAGLIVCAECGSPDVTKSIMAPSVQSARGDAPPKRQQLAAPETPAQKAIAQLRRKVEANSEYVGTDFIRQARDIHEGAAPERPIWGEARADEARKLMDDGAAILPLPFRPTRKVN
ncbi:DUF1178 domain-containing protein [Pelagivirga sediminicola]|uniref:DUF1178 domain-containing protein n=2 Tax=Pelagivirga sediminicola TaxID=2170575 RepID=A0A2T7G7X5_9RHOB|nr:DUF1178 family protein [Pelagivirga sediminicola]PVA10515.1 DUF1178 domain-containing protein [Pelagivirga sediminicola]